MEPVVVQPVGPYDLTLSLHAARSFVPPDPSGKDESPSVLRAPVRFGTTPAILEVSQIQQAPPRLSATVPFLGPERTGGERVDRTSAGALAGRLVNAGLDLRPFYQSVAEHPVLGPLTRKLHGLKSFRPATFFEMLVIAVIEQQISLTAAYRIRERLVRRFGDPLDELMVFPTPDTLAEAPLEALTDCGVSRRKAEYIRDLARMVQAGDLDISDWESLPDDAVREKIVALRGFGRWSADYLLVRGLGRVDVAPADDLGIQTLLGRVLSDGPRLSAAEVRRLLEPFVPFRGLTVFYLLAGSRLSLI